MRPTVILKVALTLDGQIAAADGSSQWISSPEARQDAHRLRARVDAVMVGAGTLRADNPRLTVRLGPQETHPVGSPRPVIVAGTRPLPTESILFGRNPIVLAPADPDISGQIVISPNRTGDKVDLVAGLKHLAELGIRNLLVEGGSALFGSLLEAGLVDRGVIYYGPLLAGGVGKPFSDKAWTTLADALPVAIESVERLGESIKLAFSVPSPQGSEPGRDTR